MKIIKQNGFISNTIVQRSTIFKLMINFEPNFRSSSNQIQCETECFLYKRFEWSFRCWKSVTRSYQNLLRQSLVLYLIFIVAFIIFMVFGSRKSNHGMDRTKAIGFENYRITWNITPKIRSITHWWIMCWSSLKKTDKEKTA